MEPAPNPRRYIPAPPPPSRVDPQKRMQLRLELAKPSDFTKETESSIVDLLRKTRTPFGNTGAAAGAAADAGHVEAEAVALENSLRSFQKELVAQERVLREKELHLTETEAALSRRATELADARRMLEKQREVFESGLRSAAAGEAPSTAITEDSLRAMKELQAKIDDQTRALDEAKEWLHEREAFLEESEKILFEKMQRQQERETELDQQAETQRTRETKLNALADKLRAKGEEI